MVRKGNSSGILSLSMATVALLQTAEAQEEQPPVTSSKDLSPTQNPSPHVTTGKVFIEPSLQKNFNKLYAGHSSHSSHASHSSHTSGVGGATYVPYSAPVPPVYQPAPVPRPAPALVAPAWTNTVAVTTGTNSGLVGSVNPAVSGEAAIHASYLKSLKMEAAKGSADSQFLLGLYYLHGTAGCETNVDKAKMLFELSAIQGNAEAKNRLDLFQSGVQSQSSP